MLPIHEQLSKSDSNKTQMWNCEIVKTCGIVIDIYERNNFSKLSQINILFYLKLQIPLIDRLFLKNYHKILNISQTFCKYLNNLFHFACRKWFF